MTNTREKLIDVFMHMGDHIRSLDEYGFGFDSTLAKAIEDVVAILKQPEADGVILATDTNVGSKWIPVSERLPEDGSDVLAYMQNSVESRIFPAVCMKNRKKRKWWDCMFNVEVLSVTHWMPLPEPPKEDE